MLALKYVVLAASVALFLIAAAVVAGDFYSEYRLPCHAATNATGTAEHGSARWRTTLALVALAWAPIMIAVARTL